MGQPVRSLQNEIVVRTAPVSWPLPTFEIFPISPFCSRREIASREQELDRLDCPIIIGPDNRVITRLTIRV